MDFIESESLYPHDIALLIDNESKKIYFYSGTKSKERERKIGIDLAEKTIKKFQLYEFVILKDVVPLKVQAQIDELTIGDEVVIKVERTIPMQISIIFGIASLILAILMAIFGLSVFGWDRPELNLYSVSSSQFGAYFNRLILIGWIWFGINCAQLVCSIWSQKIYLIVCSIASSMITLGLILYLNQRVLIFEFQSGSINSSVYLIRRIEIIMFWFWILIGSIAVFISSFISVYTIFKYSEKVERKEVSAEEMRLKSKPSILQDKPPAELKEIEPPE